MHDSMTNKHLAPSSELHTSHTYSMVQCVYIRMHVSCTHAQCACVQLTCIAHGALHTVCPWLSVHVCMHVSAHCMTSVHRKTLMQVGLATSEYTHCSCVWCGGSRLLVPCCVRACSGPTCLLSCGAAFCPSLSVLSGSKASFRFTVHRTSFKAMHYAVDCLDLDVIFPSITGPVPLPFRTQVGCTTGRLVCLRGASHTRGVTYVRTYKYVYVSVLHASSFMQQL